MHGEISFVHMHTCIHANTFVCVYIYLYVCVYRYIHTQKCLNMDWCACLILLIFIILCYDIQNACETQD